MAEMIEKPWCVVWEDENDTDYERYATEAEAREVAEYLARGGKVCDLYRRTARIDTDERWVEDDEPKEGR